MTWMWLLLLFTFFSPIASIDPGEPKCRLRIDEVSTIRPESTVHGPPFNEHSYYVALRFAGCAEKDHPSLSSYTLAIVRLSPEDSPRQIAFFDLHQFHPFMKTDAEYNRRTHFSDVHDKILIGAFPADHNGKEQGVLIDWTSLDSDTRTSILSPRDDKLYPHDDNFLTIFLLMRYDKSGKGDHKTITDKLSLGLKDESRHNTIRPYLLSRHFDEHWSTIASATVQAVGVSVCHSQVRASEITAGFQRRVKEFDVVIVPTLYGGIAQDIPLSRAVRKCADDWVLTQQSSDLLTPSHCDKAVDDMIPLTVVPSNFDWSNAFNVKSIEFEAFEASEQGDIDEERGCSPPAKKRKVAVGNPVEVVYVIGDKAYSATQSLEPCHRLMFDHESQISISRHIFSATGESERLHTLASRRLFTNPRQIVNSNNDVFILGLCFTLTNCERVFDLYSYLLYGECTKAKSIKEFILKKMKIGNTEASDLWNKKEEGRCPCFALYKNLAQFIPLNIVIKYSSKGKVKYTEVPVLEHFQSGDKADQLTPAIYIDGDSLELLAHANGLTKDEVDGLEPYNYALPAADTECPDDDKPTGGYCGDEVQSELLRLMRETHDQLLMISDGATSTPENMFLMAKMLKFRAQHSPLMHIKEDMKKEIVESEILTEKVLTGLVKSNGLTYFDVFFDKANKKINFNCYACKDSGLTNIENRRSVEWELSSTDDFKKTSSTVHNMREHHKTRHHIDSVNTLEKKAETSFLAAYKDQQIIPQISMTAVLIRASYYAAKLFIPGYRFSAVCQLIRDIGVPLGHTNTGRTAHMKVLEMISRRMRKRMIEYLINNKVPFGMELDTSTDSQGRVVLLIYISAVIEGYPRDMFYAAEYLGAAGESGGAMFKAVIDRFAKDNWLSHLDDYLIGLSTDGAASMISSDVGVGGRLRKRVEQHRRTSQRRGIPINIPHFHCAAHRVELGLADALKAFAAENEWHIGWSEAIMGVINEGATFFSIKAPKRLESLRKTAEEQQLSGSLDEVLRITHNYEARWSASTLSTMKSFARMMKLMWNNFMDYDTKLTGSTHERNLAIRAKTFLMIFGDIKFFEHLTYDIGILECVQFLSLEAQRADGTLIDFPRAFEEFEKCITAFSEDPFNPYTPAIRHSNTQTTGAKAGHDVPFMRNVVVMEANGPVPIKSSVSGKQAIYGERSVALDALRFRLDFTRAENPTTGIATIAKDTFFNLLYPLPSQVLDPNKDATEYAAEQERLKAEAQAQLDVEKARDSMLYKKFENAKLALLDKATRVHRGKTIIGYMKSRFYDEILEQAELFTVRKLLFHRATNSLDELKDKTNRMKLVKLFNLSPEEVNLDIEVLRKDFAAQVSDEMKKDLSNAQTDITLFHTALKGKGCYGKELEALIERLITLPINSASVERGYSIFNHYMSKRRGNLNIPHLDDYLFIHVNGPEPQSFVHDPYVTEWLNAHKVTENLKPGEVAEEIDEEEEDDEGSHPEWANAFEGRKDVPRITIYDH